MSPVQSDCAPVNKFNPSLGPRPKTNISTDRFQYSVYYTGSDIMPVAVFSLGLFGVVRTTWLVPRNPFAPLRSNSNYDIHSVTRLISN